MDYEEHQSCIASLTHRKTQTYSPKHLIYIYEISELFSIMFDLRGIKTLGRKICKKQIYSFGRFVFDLYLIISIIWIIFQQNIFVSDWTHFSAGV